MQLNWELVLVATIAILGIIFSGTFWSKLKHVIVQTRELIDAIADAVVDDRIDNAEIIKILKEAKDVGAASLGIYKLFQK